MGSGNWLRAIICLRKSKEGSSKKAKGSLASGKPSALESKNYAIKKFSTKGIKSESFVLHGVSVETIAATRIQTAFRAYKARKSLHRLKGFSKLKILTEGYSVRKQANTTLAYLHSWSKIQHEIRARRVYMVKEDRIRKKKLESQQKLEAKLHDLEVDWCGGSETLEETLARIHHREEAAVKRERAMAYAFSHQWRANSSQSQGLGNYELNKANWGWSWRERWIAARPWESRVADLSPKKARTRHFRKVHKDKSSLTPKTPQPSMANTSRFSYRATEKTPVHERDNKSSVVDAKE